MKRYENKTQRRRSNAEEAVYTSSRQCSTYPPQNTKADSKNAARRQISKSHVIVRGEIPENAPRLLAVEMAWFPIQNSRTTGRKICARSMPILSLVLSSGSDRKVVGRRFQDHPLSMVGSQQESRSEGCHSRCKRCTLTSYSGVVQEAGSRRYWVAI